MSQPNLPAFGPNAPPQRKSWFEKNWKWFVPVIAGEMLLVMTMFVFAILTFVFSIIRNTYPYQYATQRASESSEVADRIGAPLQFGWFVGGEYGYTGSSGHAYIQIPISGQKGRGTIIVEGDRREGRWQFHTLEVDVDGSSEPINLLEGSPLASDQSIPNSS